MASWTRWALVALVAGASALDAAQRFRAQVATAAPPATRRKRVAGVASLEMKRKGKTGGNIPGSGPSQKMLQQQREYAAYQEQRTTSGMPVFDLFVKGPNSPTWYPAGSLGGDQQSKGLCDSYKDGLLSAFAKTSIDKGVAASVLGEEGKDKFVQQILSTYPQLKKDKANLKFGYKVVYGDLYEKRPEAAQVTELTVEMTKGPLDGLKKTFGIK